MHCFSSLEEFAALRESIKEELVQTCGEAAHHLFIAINESVNNAIFHGNKEDCNKKVYLEMEQLPSEMRIIIRDEGEGFSHQEKIDRNDWRAESGRGFQIIKHCVDCYQLNRLGNEITLIKKLDIA